MVFTLPEQLAALALQNQRVVYNLLFATVAETLRTIAADPKHLGAEIDFLAVLHTWSQPCAIIPICIVWFLAAVSLPTEGAGLVVAPASSFPLTCWPDCFADSFLKALAQAFDNDKLAFHGSSAYLAQPAAFQRLLASLRSREWWVYAKPPFAGPAQVLAYLGRDTHRVAISNHRLLSCKQGQVTFSWKDYAHGDQQSLMTLSTDEFIRCFLLQRRYKLELCRTLLDPSAPAITQLLPRDYKSLYETVTGESLEQCPSCRMGTMKLTALLVPLAAVLTAAALPNHLTSLTAPQAFDSS